MSSPDTEIRTNARPTIFSPLVLLLGFTLINIAALGVCFVAAPWSESSTAAGIIVVLSAIPLGLLELLSIRIYLTHNRIAKELERDLYRSENARLLSQAGKFHDEMRNGRETSALLRHGDRKGLIVGGEALEIVKPAEKSNLTRMMEVYVLQRYVAHEDLRLNEVGKHLHEAAVDRVEPLQRDHELAFLIGLAGTVLGLIVQISLTQSSVLSQTFLTGVIVKACSTFAGIVVALYARSLRERLLEDYDTLVARLVQFASFCLAPLFIPSDRAEIGEVLRQTIIELKTTVAQVKTTLSEALTAAVETAGEALGIQLKDKFATELAEAIKEQITDPFHSDVESLKNAISKSAEGIEEGVQGLKDGTREFKEEFSALSLASTKMGGQLSHAGDVLSALAQKFEGLVNQSDLVAQKLKESEGEFAIAIERSQNNNSNHNGHWMKGELDRAIEDKRKTQQALGDMIDRIASELRKPRST